METSIRSNTTRCFNQKKYVVYNFHDNPVRPQRNFVDLIAIDPGAAHFAFTAERRDFNGRIFTIKTFKVDLSCQENGKKKEKEYNVIVDELTRIVDDNECIFSNCDHIFVEEVERDNAPMREFTQHIITYIIAVTRNKGRFPFIYRVNSKVKFNTVGCPTNLNNSAKKAWIVEFAKKLCMLRNEKDQLDFLVSLDDSKRKSGTKASDIADTKAIIEAMCRVLGLPCTLGALSTDATFM